MISAMPEACHPSNTMMIGIFIFQAFTLQFSYTDVQIIYPGLVLLLTHRQRKINILEHIINPWNFGLS
jgi:hypothetical protein